MRIDENNLSGISPSGTGASQQIRQADQASSSAVKPGGDVSGDTGGDNVQLSNLAERVSAGHLSADQSASSERSARIEHLTKLVESGQYDPAPDKIAESMIRDMLSGSGSS